MAKENSPGAYTLTHVETGLRYVGSTDRPTAREIEHKSKLNTGTHHIKQLQSVFDQHEDKSLSFEFHPTETREQAYDLEQKLLQEGRGDSLLVNRSYHSRSSKEVIPSTETRQKMSDARSGAKHSEETKDAIRRAHLGRAKSPEHIENLSAAQKKLAEDPIHRQKLKEQAMATAKSVLIEGKEYESIRTASATLSVPRATVRQRLNSPSDRFKDWKWK